MPSKIANATTAPWEDDGRAIEHPKLGRHEVADVILDRLAALRGGEIRPPRATPSPHVTFAVAERLCFWWSMIRARRLVLLQVGRLTDRSLLAPQNKKER